MTIVRRVAKLAGFGVGVALAFVLVGLALLQTGPAKTWLAGEIGRSLSAPGQLVTVSGIDGVVPFDFHIGSIVFADAAGPRMTIDDAAVAISARDLLTGRLVFQRIAARRIAVERPSTSPGGESSGGRAAEILNPPLPITLQQLDIGQLVLGEPVLGTAMTVSVTGSGTLGRGRAAADIALRRIDGTPGDANFHFALGGTPLTLGLDAEVSEPTGTVLAALLHRDDKLPVTLHLKGDGPLDRWAGDLSFTAGSVASATARLSIAGSAPYRLSVTGAAQIASLLSRDLQPLAAGGIDIAAEATLGDKGAELQKLDIASKAARIAARGRYAQADGALSGTASLTLSNLAALGSFVGMEIAGAGAMDVVLDGTLARPSANLSLRLDHIATAAGNIAAASATLALAAEGEPWAVPITLHGSGTIEGIAPASGALPAGLGDKADWQITATLDAQHEKVTGATIQISDAGAALSGSAAASLDGATGELRLTVADLAPFAAGAGSGAGDVTASFSAARDGSATIVLAGEIGNAKSGTAELDRALGPRATIGGTVRRFADGTIEASDLAIEGAAIEVTGQGKRAADGAVTANFSASLPRLAAIDPRLSGALRASGAIAGPADALSGTVTVEAPSLAASGVRVEGLSVTAALRRLMPLDARVEGRVKINGIDAVATLVASQAGQVIHVKEIAASAGGARIDGNLDIAGSKIDGRLHGRVPDLKPFSALAGMPLAGRAEVTARAAGQRYELTLDASGLGAAGATAQRVRIVGTITDPFARPAGQIEASLTGLAAGTTEVSAAKLTAKSGRAGRFTLSGEAQGKLGEKFALAAGADLGIVGGAVDLRLDKFDGALGGIEWKLGAPLAASWRGTSGRFSGLALKLGSGSLSGNGTLDGGTIALHLVARELPVHALAELGGQRAEGNLGFELTLSGTRAVPQGKLVVDGEELRFAAAARPDLPSLGLVMNADWRQGKVVFQGRLAGPGGAAIGWQGSAPLQLDPRALAVHLPKDGAVAFHLEGDGQLEALADMLPLGEDRVAGNFSVDVRVAGSVGDPLASGRATVTNGRYESLAAGAALSNVQIALVGDREKLVLEKFSASDGEAGTLGASGAVELAAAGGPALNFSAVLTRFHALKRDEVNAIASGKLTLSGSVAAPKLDAALTIDQSEIAVPEKLPQTLRPVDVVQIDSATGKVLTPQGRPAAPALVAVALNVTVDIPGKTFVRGRGLDSEWRGRLTIAGNSRQPSITGRIEAVRGTFAFIGVTFVVTKGEIAFAGGQPIAPTINLVTQAQSNDITAIVAITGYASAPTIKLSSEPDLPRDEILSRLLFGTSMSQITAAQGLQLASAAAQLAGGDGLDVLARLRKSLGLDRLTLGSAPGSVVPGIGVPSIAGAPGQATQSASGPASGFGTTPLGPTGNAGTALNAGKYVASGVYVGVSQGADASSSTVTVEVDVAKHVTVTTEAGTSSGTGIGLNWKLDY